VLHAGELCTQVPGRVVPAASGGSAAAEEGAAAGIPAEVVVVAGFPVAEVTAAAVAQAAAGDLKRDSA
jgi:hypothetical protein